MSITVTTAKAAEVVGIGYEGLRTYLKRGLLGGSGVLLPFVDRDTPAPDLSKIRSTWKRFGFTDLCLLRLAKQLIDLGLTFDQANSVISRSDMRPLFQELGPDMDALLMTWPPHQDFMIFLGEERDHLFDRLAEVGAGAVLVSLGAVTLHVRQATR